uniref:SbsA Ig-like domain-containing protein n=1 Tax=Vitrella brassicaformis TaxID=1169539 RepID=A0A7S1JLZ1_9ALVE|mmetsp:Transcript_14780/g.35243  ORF Transcript_14780/g.35243 Transcript_14780/m.35243 type:complete len:513 (+) Transcript_14780:188-1726(+)
MPCKAHPRSCTLHSAYILSIATALLGRPGTAIRDEAVSRMNTEQLLSSLRANGIDPGAAPKIRSEDNEPQLCVSLQVLKETTPYVYAHPLPNAVLVSPYTTIAFRPKDKVDRDSIDGKISVRGEESGEHSNGKMDLLQDGRTVWFRPDEPFKPGEKAYVNVRSGITTRTGKALPAAQWSFTMSWRKEDTYSMEPRNSTGKSVSSPEDLQLLKKIGDMMWIPGGNSTVIQEGPEHIMGSEDCEDEGKGGGVIHTPNCAYRTLPHRYPRMEVTSGDLTRLSHGYVFTSSCNLNLSSQSDKFHMITTSLGDPIFYEPSPSRASMYVCTFSPTNNRRLILREANGTVVIGGADYSNAAAFTADHGARLNYHDFQLSARSYRKGTGLVLIYDPQPINIHKTRGKLKFGESSSMTWLTGFTIQEITPEGQVILEWRSWDHLPRMLWETPSNVKDYHIYGHADEGVSGRVWDIAHANALDEMDDGSILISLRFLHQLIKIHRETGEIIWRLGGSGGNFG